MNKTVTILGSTGSIGRNTVEIIKNHLDKFKVIILTANENIEEMFQQCKILQPRYAFMANQKKNLILKEKCKQYKLCTEIIDSLDILKTEKIDVTIAAIIGTASLYPTYNAVLNSKRMLLASKESLVMAGDFIINAASHSRCKIIPIDSEHNAIFQCINNNNKYIDKLILTASGGAFYDLSLEQLQKITVEQALKHPNWNMGKKITIDSSTMVNKGLEVIEAAYLFKISTDKIDVVIHKQSIIHSAVSFIDGNILANLSKQDMKIAINYGLFYPERQKNNVEKLNIFNLNLTFEKPKNDLFPALNLAFECSKKGLEAQIVYNAADEIAVEYFIKKKIQFLDIIKIIDKTLNTFKTQKCNSIDDVFELDKLAKKHAKTIL